MLNWKECEGCLGALQLVPKLLSLQSNLGGELWQIKVLKVRKINNHNYGGEQTVINLCLVAFRRNKHLSATMQLVPWLFSPRFKAGESESDDESFDDLLDWSKNWTLWGWKWKWWRSRCRSCLAHVASGCFHWAPKMQSLLYVIISKVRKWSNLSFYCRPLSILYPDTSFTFPFSYLSTKMGLFRGQSISVFSYASSSTLHPRERVGRWVSRSFEIA